MDNSRVLDQLKKTGVTAGFDWITYLLGNSILDKWTCVQEFNKADCPYIYSFFRWWKQKFNENIEYETTNPDEDPRYANSMEDVGAGIHIHKLDMFNYVIFFKYIEEINPNCKDDSVCLQPVVNSILRTYWDDDDEYDECDDDDYEEEEVEQNGLKIGRCIEDEEETDEDEPNTEKFLYRLDTGRFFDKSSVAAKYPMFAVMGPSCHKWYEKIILEIDELEQQYDKNCSFLITDIGYETAVIKPLEDIQMDELEREKLTTLLDTWDKCADEYVKYDIPHRHIIAITGESGTGKTELAKSIAGWLSLDIMFIDPISGYVEGVAYNTFILDGDFNIRKFCKRFNVDFLLGTLDSWSEHYLFILTAESLEAIPSDIRSKIDTHVQLGDINKEQAENMCDYYKLPHKLVENLNFPSNPSFINKLLQRVKIRCLKMK